jgi:hypothetical protein
VARKKYLGDPDHPTLPGALPSVGGDALNGRADDIIDRKPNHDHVVKAWYRPRGSKTSLTEEAIEQIATLVAGGNTIPVACAACGYGTSWRNWHTAVKEHLLAGYEPGFEEGQSPYLAYAEAITQAKASWEVSMVAVIASGNPNYKGPLALLERRLPNYYQERKSVQVAVKNERDIAQGMSTEELQRALAEDAAPALPVSQDATTADVVDAEDSDEN